MEKEERVLERERESTFSLDFSTIGSSNPGKARGKVDPHCKGYAWVPVLGGGVSTTPRGRGLLLLGYFLSKNPLNGFGCCEAGNGHGFRFQRSGTNS